MLALDRSSTPVCSNFTSLGDRYKRTWALGGITLARFANQTLSGVLDRHVMDQTGVAGVFKIRLEFGYDDSIKQGVFGGRPAGRILGRHRTLSRRRRFSLRSKSNWD